MRALPPSEGLAVDFIGIFHETVDNPKKLLNAVAAVGFSQCDSLLLETSHHQPWHVICKGMVRALFFHVMDGATDELFADSRTKRTTKEKAGAMLDDAEMYLDNLEGCCDTEDEDVVKGGRRVQGEEEDETDGQTRNTSPGLAHGSIPAIRGEVSVFTFIGAVSPVSRVPPSAVVQLDDECQAGGAPSTRRRERPWRPTIPPRPECDRDSITKAGLRRTGEIASHM